MEISSGPVNVSSTCVIHGYHQDPEPLRQGGSTSEGVWRF